ncbi:MAG: Sapep family Mn(2+)-dependent dipeptidase [Clostridium argentinense]|uniref:Sapep family Mn(2+)-dependent dipeptidase n=1 Tax=Clostridium faecium TaxID=2762223 RepID=A0ABR8YNP4_9CLOT|nr:MULTISPECIES: Sapep family Mn(2+)-dependent dipeptidase [Clostridium]MBD8045871.1 Sapep family Mn(2+)-dependent dipeptidase [Clostridium faecium]MBS5824176.1 Sapep family Mn(2+)-dependent dipeptidase [Clostridium argentinense]
MEINEIRNFLEENKKNIINDTRDLVAIPSVSEDINKVKEALRLAIEKASNMGFKAYTVLNDSTGIIEMGEGKETIGILTHIDVVPEGDLKDWKTNPFELVEKDGLLFGRGVLDDKGPIISALYAMEAIRKLNIPVKKKIQLIIGTQEEVEWTDMYEYVKKYSLPDYGFTPDGQFPICNKEKGYADIVFNFDEKCTSSTGSFEILSFQSGNATNSIPSTAKATLKGNFENLQNIAEDYIKVNKDEKISLKLDGNTIVVTAQGVACHSAYPQQGVNPIIMLGKFLNTLDLKLNAGANLVKFIAEFCYDYFGKGLDLYSESEYLNGEYMHRNVISPTVVKFENNIYKINLNMRPVYGTTLEGLKETLSKVCEKAKCTFEIDDFLSPIFVSKEKPFLKIMEDTYNELSGLKNEFTLGHGTSYAKAMPNTVAWGPVFYDEDECCHIANEYISVEKLLKATEIYAVALGRMVSTEDSLI